MKYDLAPIRIGLYSTLILFSFILFCLSAKRTIETVYVISEYPLSTGGTIGVTPSYDPILMVIMITAVMTILWCIFIIVCIHKRVVTGMIFTFRGELIGLGVLLLSWIVGASIAFDIRGRLCSQSDGCRVVFAMIAFSWMGGIVLTVILAISMLFTIANKAFKEPLHGRWHPRASTYNNNA